MRRNHMLYLDVMIGNEWKGQVKYDGPGLPIMLEDGFFMESYDLGELRSFVEDRKPSLKGKDYHLEFSNQRV